MSAPPGTRAVVLLADYIGVDLAGKVNVLGGGFTVTGLQPQLSSPGTLVTAPQYVAAIIDVPATAAGDQLPVTLELSDEDTGTAVVVPYPDGTEQALRVTQMITVQRAQIPGFAVPRDLPCRLQTVLGFPNGLPLAPGHRYVWKLEVDGVRYKSWSAHFFVAAPPPAPVVGGPAGAASIPDVLIAPTEFDDEVD